MNPRAIDVKFKKPFSLVITFINNEVKEFNLIPYLNYPVYEKLQDEAYCRKATVLGWIIVWDEETDLDPDTVYLESHSVISV